MRIADEQYSDAILAAGPCVCASARELPSVTTRVCPESRSAIWAEIDFPGGTIQIINTHLGLGAVSESCRRNSWLVPNGWGKYCLMIP